MAAGDAGAHEVLVRAVLLSICVHQLVHQSTPEPHVHQLLSAHAGAHEVLVRFTSIWCTAIYLCTPASVPERHVHQLLYCYLLMYTNWCRPLGY